jgi:hypothetical protein
MAAMTRKYRVYARLWGIIARIAGAPAPGLMGMNTAMLITGARSEDELKYILSRDNVKQWIAKRIKEWRS